MGAVEPRRGSDGITALYRPDRSACIAASPRLDSSHTYFAPHTVFSPAGKAGLTFNTVQLKSAGIQTKQVKVGAVEPRRGCDGITALYLPNRSACIAASPRLDSSHNCFAPTIRYSALPIRQGCLFS